MFLLLCLQHVQCAYSVLFLSALHISLSLWVCANMFVCVCVCVCVCACGSADEASCHLCFVTDWICGDLTAGRRIDHFSDGLCGCLSLR